MNMDAFSHVPPGFRFHPTDEELVNYYLRKKVISKTNDLDVIRDIDLYKIEPWDLQEKCKIGTQEHQNEWYFFSHKDKKYPTGSRTNRATAEGFWKATGRDKAIYAKNSLVGMRKTLVFYKGRAPNGQKSDWIMHEYRLENQNTPHKEEGWVVCRVFKKRSSTIRRNISDLEPSLWYDYQEQVSFLPHQHPEQSLQQSIAYDIPYFCKQEVEMNCNSSNENDCYYLQNPLLENSDLPNSTIAIDDGTQDGSILSSSPFTPEYILQEQNLQLNMDEMMETSMDWRVLDHFVASQLSQEGTHYTKPFAFHVSDQENLIQEMGYASTSTSSNHVHM